MDHPPLPDPAPEPVERPLAFPVVGVGASAGGLAALQRLLGGFPERPGMAFVVVMHLAPDHVSTLGAILDRLGVLPVVTVVESTRIEPDHVYVIPPAMALTMHGVRLQVDTLEAQAGPRHSIDLFFRTLAEAHAGRAIGVVLSGTGSDGAQGLKRIKELGGVTIAQRPEDAEFDGMPRAAAETGVVDVVLRVDEMPAMLRRLARHGGRTGMVASLDDVDRTHAALGGDRLAEEALLSIEAMLRERTGHDFSHYKRGTVLRRLERRMQVHAVPDLPSYRRLLDAVPDETRALLQDLLISVTNFFRDPAAFEALDAAMALALAGRPADEPLRVWVAGCATGEEAYSIAILLRELLPPSAPAFQVFASDIDAQAIAVARSGSYPASIATDVSPDRLERHFVATSNGFRVGKALREPIVFSTHNVLSDPAFTRMDLICCRNVMIYLDRAAQDQLLRGFHRALRPRGLLFLGSSETPDAVEGLYDGVDKLHRVYRARATSAFPRASVGATTAAPIAPTGPDLVSRPVARPAPGSAERLHERVLQRYGPPTLLVDPDDTVLHVGRDASHLLRLGEGAPSDKLMNLARPELRAELRAALIHAARTGESVEAPRVRLEIDGRARTILITVRPAVHETPPGLMLVVFDETAHRLDAGDDVRDRDPLVTTLEEELTRTQELLRTTVGESAASTEELRASNEELQTINEELRSTTEELESSREELQSVNEELTTVNGELTLRVDEAIRARDDWQNLMASAQIGTVVVDRAVRVKRYSPEAAALFHFRPGDVGRPLLDLTNRLDYPLLADDIAAAVSDLRRIEREVRSEDGRWFLARVAPYQASGGQIDGAMIALLDVTARRLAEERLQASEQRMARVAGIPPGPAPTDGAG